jgi:hypothetical protein
MEREFHTEGSCGRQQRDGGNFDGINKIDRIGKGRGRVSRGGGGRFHATARRSQRKEGFTRRVEGNFDGMTELTEWGRVSRGGVLRIAAKVTEETYGAYGTNGTDGTEGTEGTDGAEGGFSEDAGRENS